MLDKQPQWIWNGDAPDDQHVWGWARRSFDLDSPGGMALEISADLRYMLWVNGRRIGFGPPKFHAATPTIDRYEISDLAQEKNNVIVVLVYSLGDYKISSVMPKRGGLWVRLTAGVTQIVSDSSWKMRRDPGYWQETASRGSSQPPCEIYDARLGLDHPETADYDDAAWPYAREIGTPPDMQMEVRDIPFMAAEEFAPDRAIEWGMADFTEAYTDIPFDRLAPLITQAKISPDRDSRISPTSYAAHLMALDASGLKSSQVLYVLFDMGRLWTGYPVLTIRGTPGTVVDIIYSEDLLSHRPRPAKNPFLPYLDRVILGSGVLSHRITWPKCARYIQLNVHGGDVVIGHLALERSTYPVQWAGFFASDRPALNQAWEISTHTVQLDMEDSYMDTPWRERGSWLGDDRIKCGAAYAVFGDYALARRFLLQIARGQRPDGTLASKYPANMTSHITTWTLSFSLSVFDYCRASGDWEFGREMLPVVKGVVGWLDSCMTGNGVYEAPPVKLTHHEGTYNFIDWAPVDMRGANTAWNAFAYESLRCSAALSARLGESDFATVTSMKAESLKAAFQRVFWNEAQGVFANGLFEGKLLSRWGCQENFLALLFELATPKQTDAIRRQLEKEDTDNVFIVNEDDYDVVIPESGKIPTVALALSCYRWPDEKMVPLGTPYFAHYMLQVLIEAGRANSAQDFIEKRWGEFSRQGATSVWEVWDMKQSLSHGWSCSPVALAAHYFLGLHQLPFPQENFRILPVAGRLHSARGRVMTRFGPVQIEWNISPDWTLEIDLPAGAEFQVGVPVREGCLLKVDGKAAESTQRLTHCLEDFDTVVLSCGKHLLRHILKQ